MKGSSSSKKPSKKKKGKQQSLETIKEEPEEKPRIKILQRKAVVSVDKKKQEQEDEELLREAQLEVLEELQNGNPSIPTKPKLSTEVVKLFNLASKFKVENRSYDQLMKRAADEGHPEAAYEYAEYLCEEGKFDQAFSYYMFAYNHGQKEAAYNIAVQYQAMGQYKDAFVWYLKDLRMSNNMDEKVDTVFNIGIICLKFNNIPAALRCAKFCADKGEEEAKKILEEVYNKLIEENTPFYEVENDAKDLVSERIPLEVVDSDTLPGDILAGLIKNPKAKWADEEWADYSDLGEVEVSGAIEEEPET